jgi:hypothetical protein
MSLCLYEGDGFNIIGDWPCCVIANKCNEYAAVKNLNKANENTVDIEILIIDLISIISLSKLTDGGAAMFADRRRNHHIDMVGQIDSIPLVKYTLRV